MASFARSLASRALNPRLLDSVLRPGNAAAAASTAPTPEEVQIYPPLDHDLPHHAATHAPNSQSPQVHLPSNSVSQNEVSHFSRLASTWWDPHGPSRLLHLMNPLRHDFINSCLNSTTSPASPHTSQSGGLTYLDVGCGGGIFSCSAARLATTQAVTAIDPTAEVIAVAKTHQRTDPALSPPKLSYLVCAIEDLPLPRNKNSGVDIVTLFEVLEHVSSPSAFLRSCTRHLKPGGWLIGSTIARSPLSFLTTKLIGEAPLLGVVPKGTHDWNKYINPGELSEWFQKENQNHNESWSPLKAQGVIYVPAFGWKTVNGSEGFGNYFFGLRKLQ